MKLPALNLTLIMPLCLSVFSIVTVQQHTYNIVTEC